MEFNFYKPKKLKGISLLIWELKADEPKGWIFLPEFNIDLAFNQGEPWMLC